MKQTITLGTNTMLAAAKRLMLRGELTRAQYDEMCQRNENLAHDKRIDVVKLSD